MARILVLIPVKPNLHPSLRARCRDLAAALPAANPLHQFALVLDGRGPGDRGVTPLRRPAHVAAVRQAMVEEHLGDHDYVFWVDADVVRYPADLPTTLVQRSPTGVSAPLVLLEGHGDRFYDIGGFVEGGRWAEMWPPYFQQPGPVFDLDGVGCVYLVPAAVYRRGARHEPVPGFTEHLSVCRHARRLGVPVRAYADLLAYHADLARYGEAYH